MQRVHAKVPKGKLAVHPHAAKPVDILGAARHERQVSLDFVVNNNSRRHVWVQG